MAFTKFKLLAERLLSGLGRSKTFFPFYDSQNDADYRVSLDTLITFISNELGVSSKAVFELTGVSNTGNNYVSTLDITSYKTEGLYIFKPSVDSDDVSTLNVNSIGILDIKEFNGTSIVDKTDLKAVNTYLLLNKTSYWLVVGGVSGGSGGVSTFSALTDSPYDNTLLAEALDSKQDKPNGVLTGCTITLGSFPLGKNVRITEGTWRISPSEYGNVGSGDTDFLVALSASGLQRYVEIVGTSSNTIIKVEGAENAIAVRPTLGIGQVSLGSILVKDALIDPPVPDLSGYVPLNGTELINGSFKTPLSGLKRSEFAITPTLINLESGTSTDSSKLNLNDVEIIQAVNLSSVYLGSRFFQIKGGLPYLFKFDILKIEGLTHAEIAAKINAEPYGLITKQYADDKYIHVVIVANDFIAENNKIYNTIGSLTVTDPTPVGGSGYDILIMSTNVVVGGVTYSIAGTYIRRRYVGGVWISYLSTGVTNLGYTPSPTNGIVTSDTGTDATLTLVDGTNAGLVSPSMKSTWDAKQDALTFGTGVLTALGVNTGTNGSFVVRGSSDYEVPLTFSTGLTRTSNTITNNLSTGVSGGQTLIGSTSTTSGLTVKATSGVGTTGADIIFQVGNNGATEAMRILNSGNVGIGTVSPLSQLHLSDGNTIGASLSSQIGTNSIAFTSNTSSFVRLFTSSNTAATGAITANIKSRGTVTTPTTLATDDLIGGNLFGGHDGSGVNYGANIYAFCDATPSAGETPTRISIVTGGSSASRAERMRVSSNGLIGIGTTTPQSRLSVTSGLAVGATYAGTTAAPANGLIVEGNVGIGISSPSTKLHVVGNTILNGNLRYESTTINLVNLNYPAFNFIGLLTKTHIRINTTVGVNIIEAFPAASNGTVLIISIVGTYQTTFRNEHGGAGAGDRFLTNTGADVVVPVNGSISFIYDAISSRWRQF